MPRRGCRGTCVRDTLGNGWGKRSEWLGENAAVRNQERIRCVVEKSVPRSENPPNGLCSSPVVKPRMERETQQSDLESLDKLLGSAPMSNNRLAHSNTVPRCDNAQ